MAAASMKIGKVQISGLCRLAPMAGISNIPFRVLCKELGSSLTTSEEISAPGLIHNHKRTFEIADYLPVEKPIAMQLVGAKPHELAEAARILQDKGADIVDLNMGCPVQKIIKTGAGSALMREPEKAIAVFRAIRKAIDIPFTIKIRGGWDVTCMNAPEIARLAEAEGVDAIAVHPRTRSQQYSGHAPWEIIRLVVESVSIPVTGNGDVKSYADAARMQAETGCVSVMIGRGALGKPWVFDPEFDKLSPGAQHEYKFKKIQRHFDLIREYMNDRFALVQMKKHAAWYTAGLKGAAKVRNAVFQLESAEAVMEYIYDYWVSSSESESVDSNLRPQESVSSVDSPTSNAPSRII